MHPDDMHEASHQAMCGQLLLILRRMMWRTTHCFAELLHTIDERCSTWLLGQEAHETFVAVSGRGELDDADEFAKLLKQKVGIQPVPRPIKLRCLILYTSFRVVADKMMSKHHLKSWESRLVFCTTVCL